MPWTNQQGGDGGDRGPWGRAPQPSGGGGNNRTPPDFEEMLRRMQNRLRRYLPGGVTGGSLLILLLGIVVVWLLSGIYVVNGREQGVVLRFGQFVARTGPGINYHLPWPIESVEVQDVTSAHQINIGYQEVAESDASHTEDVPEESLMLTGDENIVDVNFTVYWVINNAGDYVFNVEEQERTIKAVAESAMREVVGENEIGPILTQDRAPIENQVLDLMQSTLNSYRMGVTITQVKMQNVDTPIQVRDAYRDVQAARADQERRRNEAEAYANKIIPEARGQAAQIVQDALAYKQKVIAEASGEAKRFLSVYEEYKKAPEVTRKRMYLETLSHIYAQSNKVIVDENAAKNIIPYLPPQALGRGSQETVTVTPQAGAAATAGPSP